MENKPWIYQWHFNPSIILLAAMLVLFYYRMGGFGQGNKTLTFWTAIFFLLMVEWSPLHYLGMHYYFGAHMIGHVILLLICGPLLVISLPKNTLPGMKKLSAFLNGHSWAAWLTGVGIMWVWHIPAVFDASFAAMGTTFSLFPLLHAGSMLLAGTLFSWPLFGPVQSDRIQPLPGIVYLFTACISCSLLGLLITFAPITTYHHYTGMMQMGNPFNITKEQDQQAAGLIMWVPCCMVYLSGCMFLLYRLVNETDAPQLPKLNTLTTSLNHHD